MNSLINTIMYNMSDNVFVSKLKHSIIYIIHELKMKNCKYKKVIFFFIPKLKIILNDGDTVN